MPALLTARGFTVTISARCPDVVAAAAMRAEVVVVDAGGSLARAEQDVARAGLLTNRRAVVFVTDCNVATCTTAPVVQKWASLEQLCDAIEAAQREKLGEARARTEDGVDGGVR
jgi:hypothetical protein